MKLLTRDQFREGVFARDKHQCVICKAPAQDAHHILERRLWSDGGYYLENGASLCGSCHILAEETTLSCDEIRKAAGIERVILPDHLYRDIIYDKWGNPVLANGMRLKGELFGDESVQKILGQGKKLDLFSEYVKYPRTYHLPWSECVGKDDRVHSDLSAITSGQVVITEKMDGENTTMYSDYMHARSLDSKSHPTQSWVRNLHAKISHNIKPGWRLCGENLYAKHSIKYTGLDSYFYLFSIWDENNYCLSWDETEEYARLLEIPTVPVLYHGPWDDKIPKTKWVDTSRQEGYVIRTSAGFSYSDFRRKVGKFVRKNHVIGTHHWKFSEIELNSLTTNVE